MSTNSVRLVNPRLGQRVWVHAENKWHKATVLRISKPHTKSQILPKVRTDSDKIIATSNIYSMPKEVEVLSGLVRTRPSPSVTLLRKRCQDKGYLGTSRKRKHELIQLLLPRHSDNSLVARDDRYFLGVDLPCAPTPIGHLVKAPPALVQVRGTAHNVGDSRAAAVGAAIQAAM